MGADVEEQVPRRRGGPVPVAGELPKRMELGRPRLVEDAIPGPSADADHAAQLSLGEPEADRPLQPGDLREQIRNSVLLSLLQDHGEEDRRFGDRRKEGLRLSRAAHMPRGGRRDA